MPDLQSELSKATGRDRKSSSSKPEHDVTVEEGHANVKTPIGNAKIPLKEKDQEDIIQNVKDLQRAEIHAKRAALFNTVATTVLAALSAVAIGTTLIRGSQAEKQLKAAGV